MVGLFSPPGLAATRHMCVLTTNKALAEFVLELWNRKLTPTDGKPYLDSERARVKGKKGSWGICKWEVRVVGDSPLQVWAIVDWKNLRVVGFTNSSDMDGPWMGEEA